MDPHLCIRRAAQAVEHGEGLVAEEAAEELAPFGQFVGVETPVVPVARLHAQPDEALQLPLVFGPQAQLTPANLEAVGVGAEALDAVALAFQLIAGEQQAPRTEGATVVGARRDLASITRLADILIVAIGKPEFITAEMVKEGAVVVDVGIHRMPDTTRKQGFRLVGDVKADEVGPKCSWLSPVPGGVGPMTITSLLLNTLKAAHG
jgi:hypothetical protein